MVIYLYRYAINVTIFYQNISEDTLSKLNNQTATFTFNGLISDPSSTVS